MKRATPRVELEARCTTCRKIFDVTQVQLREARAIGCLFSPCCSAVATPHRASLVMRKGKP